MIPVPQHGAEDVVVAADGTVYTGTVDGSIFRLSPDGSVVECIANTGGRPLGIEIAADGRLLVCDAYRGLLWIDPQTGAIEGITDSIDGVPMAFCNNAAIAADGTFWFSDSTQRRPLHHWRKELIENSRTGRLLRRDTDGTVTCLADDLAFANGVALAADESFVVVAETAARTVVRLWRTGPRAGEREFFVADLPGYPDNLARGSDGLIWVTLGSPTVGVLSLLHRLPRWVRRIVAAVPTWMQPKEKRTIQARAYDTDGRLVHDIDLRHPEFHMVTGVREHNGTVWLASLEESALAAIDL